MVSLGGTRLGRVKVGKRTAYRHLPYGDGAAASVIAAEQPEHLSWQHGQGLCASGTPARAEKWNPLLQYPREMLNHCERQTSPFYGLASAATSLDREQQDVKVTG